MNVECSSLFHIIASVLRTRSTCALSKIMARCVWIGFVYAVILSVVPFRVQGQPAVRPRSPVYTPPDGGVPGKTFFYYDIFSGPEGTAYTSLHLVPDDPKKPFKKPDAGTFIGIVPPGWKPGTPPATGGLVFEGPAFTPPATGVLLSLGYLGDYTQSGTKLNPFTMKYDLNGDNTVLYKFTQGQLSLPVPESGRTAPLLMVGFILSVVAACGSSRSSEPV